MNLNCLKDIFNKTCLINSEQDEITIRETDNKKNERSLKKVKIKNLENNEIFCLKADKHVPLTKYFNSTSSFGLNKGVDAIIFFIKDGKGYLFFIELKSYTLNKKNVANKFFASTAFIHQIRYLAKNIYGEEIDTYLSSAIVFSLNSKNNRLEKFGMRPDAPTFTNQKYENTVNTIQVLEIQKNNGTNFNISIDKIIEEARPKELKSWL